MEPSGAVEIDMQFGGLLGRGTRRAVLPDYEIDLGLTRPCGARARASVASLGGLVDPVARGGRGHPWGLLLGIDFAFDLEARQRWAITSAIAVGCYGAVYQNEATLTAGIAYRPGSYVDLSLMMLASPLRTADQVGVLFGISPRFRLW